MNQCDNIPTLKQLQDVATNSDVLNESVTSDQDLTPTTATDGEQKKTLAHFERQYNEAIQAAGGVPLGTWATGVTYNAYNEYLVYNGIPYKPAASTTLPYTTQGADPTVAPDAGNVVPFAEVQASDLVVVREDLLGPGAQLFMGDDGESVKVGDTLPAGTTHLRVEIGGDVKLAFLQNGYDDFSGSVDSISSSEVSLTNGKVSRLYFGVVAPTQYTLRGYSYGVDVFVLYGQSNTVGYADNTSGFPENEYDTDYWRYDTQTLETVDSGMRFSSGNVSTGHAWMEFSNTYTSKTGRKCILIPCAKGGSTIAELSKGGTVYTAMQDSIADFETFASTNGITINSRSLLFHQGETDMSDGTSHNDYIPLLDNLLRDIRSDFNVEKTYIARVGCPQNRTEESWYAIQSAQDFLAQSYDWVVMSFTGCGSFTIGNGLLREGVHYTQLGYNFMGASIGETVASDIVNPTPGSTPEQYQYGGLLTTPDQIWRHTYGRCSYSDALGWTLRDIDDTSQPYRAVNVEKIEDLGDRLRVFVQSRGDYIIDTNINVNAAAERYGLRVAVAPVTATLNVRAFDLYFYKDLNFILSLDTGSIAPPPDASGSSPFLGRLSSEAVGSDAYRVLHPRSEAFPLITPVYGASAVEASIKPVFITLNSAVSFIVKSFATSGAKAYCSVPNALLQTGEIIDGVEISISAIVAAKKL